MAKATLDDLKKILEQIAAQGGSGTGGKQPDPQAQQAAVDAAERRVELAQQEYDAYNNMSFIRNGIFEDEEKLKLLREAELDLQKAEIDLLEKKSKITTGYNAHMSAHYKQQAEQRKKEADNDKKRKKAEDRQRAAQKDAIAKGKEFAGQYTQIIAKSTSLGMNQSAIGKSIASGAGSLMKMVGSMASLVMSAVSFGSALVAAGVAASTLLVVLGALMIVLLPLAIGGAILGGLIAFAAWAVSMAIEARDLAASFTRLTGATMDYGKEIIELRGELAELGIGAKELTAAYGALYKQTTIFTQATESQRKNMGATVAMLEKWGITAETTAKIMQTMVTSLSVSVETVGDEMAALKGHAQLLQVDIAAYMQDFSAMGAELAVYDDAVGTFKSLAAAQKVTGMEMRKIIDLSRKFDTFESAAKMAGNLNAALGGNFVNAMDMMTETDPVKRFEMIRDALKDGGAEFETMGYYAKRFYMEQLGLKDVSELAVLMRGDLNDLSGDYGKSADELLKLRKQTQQYQSTLDIFKGFLAKMQPVLSNFVDPIQEWIETLTDPDGGATPAFEKLQETLTKVVTKGLMPLMENLPELTKRFLGAFNATATWISENDELIEDLAMVLKLTIKVAAFAAKLVYYWGKLNNPFGGNMGFGGPSNYMGVAEASRINNMSEEARKAKYSVDEIAEATKVAEMNNRRFGASLDSTGASFRGFTIAANRKMSLSFNESLAFYNDQFGKMPSSIDKASRAVSSMKSPISSATSEMNKLGESTATTVNEAKKLFKPGTFKATGTVGFQEVMTGRASAGVTGPAATSTAPQNSSPLVKQPVEIVLRTEEGVLAKQVINVIGREIQSVIA